MVNPLIYAIKSKNYLDSLSLFVKDLMSSEKQNELLIILPNYLSIDLFKFIFANLQIKNDEGACFIPNILPYEDYLSRLNASNSSNLKHYEQVLIMTSIVRRYDKTQYNAVDAILIANQIIRIYWELKKNNISYSDINNWVEEDISEHWWATAEFLKFCFTEYDKVALDTIYENIVPDFANNTIVIAGIVDRNVYGHLVSVPEDIKQIILLPPITDFGGLQISNSENLEVSNKFLYNHYKHLLARARYLNTSEDFSKYQNYLVEFYDLFEEADYLFHKIYTRKDTISIILNNPILEKLIANRLDILNIPYNSSFGISYNNFLEVELLLNLAKFKSSDGNITDMMSVLKSRIFLQNSKIQEIVEVIFQQDRFFENFRELEQILSCGCSEQAALVVNILNDFLEYNISNKFSDLLQKTIHVFIILYDVSDNKITNADTEKFKNFIIDIQNIKYQDYEINYDEFATFIYQLFSLKYTKAFNREAPIFLLKPEDAILIDTSEIFFADFNQDSYLDEISDDIWLSKKILKKIGLLDEAHNFENLEYIVSTKLDKQSLYFTRSNYKNGALVEKCALLNLISNLQKIGVDSEAGEIQFEKYKSIKLSSYLLPKILYPTNIEQLIRDPYGFFARKILGLKIQREVDSVPENKDYGQVVHELIESVTNKTVVATEKLVEEVLNRKGIPTNIAFLWKNALYPVASVIDERNKNILSQNGRIFSEIEGQCEFKLLSNIVSLKAIADRIEVLENKIRIIDFKTGQVPSKKDIFQGKSPQLIIEAIILINNGFNLIIPIENKSIELVYIKVNSRAPYFDETIIPIHLEEIMRQQEGLRGFLNSYYKEEGVAISNDYLPEFWKPQYDDYKHFRRASL